MKFLTTTCFIAFTSIAAPAMADPSSDAQTIVNLTVTQELFEAAITANKAVIYSAVQHDLNQSGIKLAHPERFLDLVLEEFIQEFTQTMRAQTAQVYLDTFSPKELKDIANFLQTDSGAAQTAAAPKLIQEGARMGAIAGQQAAENALPRLAERIEAEGLLKTEDPSLVSRLLKTFQSR